MTRTDEERMSRALELAARGQGHVEPNPMVGCVIVGGESTVGDNADGNVASGIVGEGWHRRFGAPHAEVEALRAAGQRARGGTLYVTLEPCCHHGKTPPCTDAILAAGIARVVCAVQDPFPQVQGAGARQLEQAGVRVEFGLLADAARGLNAPYFKRIETGRPWVIGKWAMSVDGKIATPVGESRWITGEASRAVVHGIRGRVDAVLVGRGTAEVDDPQLTARPPGARVATRIVLDSDARLPTDSQLARTAREVPVLVAAAATATRDRVAALQQTGCEVLTLSGGSRQDRLLELLSLLGGRGMTNILVEGGGMVLGAFLDARQMDEVLAFVGPRLVGGGTAPGPIAGDGFSRLADAAYLVDVAVSQLGNDLLIRGRVSTRPG